MTDEEYYERMYSLCYINRYDTTPRVKDESVAEHSFLVAALVLKLHTKYKFDLGIALTIAISHDILENETGDVGHLVKKNYPKLYNVLKEAEKSAIVKYPESIQKGIAEYDKNSTVESLIVHMADSIQVKQYAENEIRLGSIYYFNEVKQNSIKRINTLKEKLKDYKYE